MTYLLQHKNEIIEYAIMAVFGTICAAGFLSHPGVFVRWAGESGDLEFHVTRVLGAIEAIKDGQLIPQVSANDLYGYGYGANIFYGPLPIYIIVFLKVIMHNIAYAFNCYIVLCFIFSGVCMLKFMKEFSSNNKLSLLVSVFYITSPPLVWNAYFKTGVGEMLVFVVAPLVLLGIVRLIYKQVSSVPYLVLAGSSIVLSHNLSIVLFGCLFFLILLFNIKSIINKKCICYLLVSAIGIFLLTSFYTLPLLECKLSNLYPIFDNSYTSDYMGLRASNLNAQRYSFLQIFNVVGDSSCWDNFGFLLIPSLVLPPICIAKKGIQHKRIILAIYVIEICFIAVEIYPFNWALLPSFCQKVQMLCRFRFVYSFCSSVLVGWSVMALLGDIKLSQSLLISCICFTIGFICVYPCIYNCSKTTKSLEEIQQIRENNPYKVVGTACEYITDANLNINREIDKEGALSDFLLRQYSAPGNAPTIIQGSGNIEFSRNGSQFEIDLKNQSETCIIQIPRLYYPGYQATLDNSIVITECGTNGLVNIWVQNNSNEATIKVFYGLSNFTLIGIYLTAIGVLALVTVSILYKTKFINIL